MARVRASGSNRRVSAVRLNNKNRTVVSSEVEDEEDTMVVPVNKFNTLKREYEKTKSLVRRLSGTVQLYEEKCARLLNEKTAIQLQFESAESALTSSASASSRVNQRANRNGISSARIAMKKENHGKNYPPSVIDYVSDYMNKMTPSVHKYISEVTEAQCIDMHGNVPWSPNIILDDEDCKNA